MPREQTTGEDHRSRSRCRRAKPLRAVVLRIPRMDGVTTANRVNTLTLPRRAGVIGSNPLAQWRRSARTSLTAREPFYSRVVQRWPAIEPKNPWPLTTERRFDSGPGHQFERRSR